MFVININKANFRSEVMNPNKPILLDFWASWCGPCRMVASVVEEIAEERYNIKVGKVNVDGSQNLPTSLADEYSRHCRFEQQ